jgi:hypothetical protein
VIAGDAATTNSGLSKATGGLRGCAHPCGELCTETEHEPVDSLVHEILAASSTGDHCNFMIEGPGLGQGEKSAVFPRTTIIGQNE